MSNRLKALLFLVVVVGIAATTANRTAIRLGIMQTDMDGGGNSITNVRVVGTIAGDGSGLSNQTGGVFTRAGSNIVMVTNANVVTVHGLTDTNIVTSIASLFASSVGQPVVTVSAKGIANGLSGTTNNGLMFGPDTAGTTTYGIQEAINYLPTATNYTSGISGGGKLVLEAGRYICAGEITLPNDYPFNFSMAGSGKLNTFILYTGTNDWITTSLQGATNPYSLYGSLNMHLQDLAFVYQNDTQKKHIMYLRFLNEALIENCLFTTFQSILDTGLVYAQYTPTNAVGVVGLRTDGGQNNLLCVRNTAFTGLACGALIQQDHVRFEDCFWGSIGIYFTNAQASGVTTGTVWTASANQTYTNIYSIGAGLVADGGPASALQKYEFHVMRNQFYFCNVGLLAHDLSQQSHQIVVEWPNAESVNIDFAGDYALGTDASMEWISSFAYPVVRTFDSDTGALGSGPPSNFKRFDVGRNGFGLNIASNTVWNLGTDGRATFTTLTGAVDRVVHALPNGSLYATIPTNAIGTGGAGDTAWRTNANTIYVNTLHAAIGTNHDSDVSLEIATTGGSFDEQPLSLRLLSLDHDTTPGIRFWHPSFMTNEWLIYTPGDLLKITKDSVTNFLTIYGDGKTVITSGITNLAIAGTGVRYLEADANGKISAVNPTNLGSLWTPTGSDTYRAVGKVGIGKAPEAVLHVLNNEGGDTPPSLLLESYDNDNSQALWFKNTNHLYQEFFIGQFTNSFKIGQATVGDYMIVDTNRNWLFNSNATISGILSNQNLGGGGVRFVEVDANGKLSATIATNQLGAGGAATNVVWPVAGTNIIAITNGLEVTINAEVSHAEVQNATNGLKQALGTAAFSNTLAFVERLNSWSTNQTLTNSVRWFTSSNREPYWVSGDPNPAPSFNWLEGNANKLLEIFYKIIESGKILYWGDDHLAAQSFRVGTWGNPVTNVIEPRLTFTFLNDGEEHHTMSLHPSDLEIKNSGGHTTMLARWGTWNATITCLSETTNGQNITINGDTRTWLTSATNPATQIAVGASAEEVTTNLYNSLTSYPILYVNVAYAGPTSLSLTTSNAWDLSIKMKNSTNYFEGAFNVGWGTYTYSTTDTGVTFGDTNGLHRVLGSNIVFAVSSNAVEAARFYPDKGLVINGNQTNAGNISLSNNLHLYGHDAGGGRVNQTFVDVEDNVHIGQSNYTTLNEGYLNIQQVSTNDRTRIMAFDAFGNVGEFSLGNGLAISSSTLSATGNGSGLSNTVDLIAGANITITTNANNRSFTIAGSAGGANYWGTNSADGSISNLNTSYPVIISSNLIVKGITSHSNDVDVYKTDGNLAIHLDNDSSATFAESTIGLNANGSITWAGTSQLQNDGGIVADGTVVINSQITLSSDGGQTNSGTIQAAGFVGNGAGLTNAVDLIAGSNITITTNANARSFTIASTGGGGATNAVTTIQTNGVQLATGVTNLNFTNFIVRPSAIGGTVTVDGTSWSKQLITGSLIGGSIASGVRIVMPNADQTATTGNALLASGQLPIGGYLTNFQVWSSVAWPSTTNMVLTLKTNVGLTAPVATPITCTLAPASGSTYTNSGTTFLVLPTTQHASGNVWILELNTSSGLAAQTLSWSVEWWH